MGRCGHMTNAPEFNSLQEMEQSAWLTNIMSKFAQGEWPQECIRCQKSEQAGEKSIREFSIDEEKLMDHHQPDYLKVGGVLDNVCNAACQTCNEDHSTFIAAKKKVKVKVNNLSNLYELPWERITHLDLNGGEPSYSKNYLALLSDLPPNLVHLRLNTNGNRVLQELDKVVRRGVNVTVTISLDGIGRVHEYMRWPILWKQFYDNLQIYKQMPVQLNMWTTVSALNLGDFSNIVDFVKSEKVDHSWAFLENPDVLNVKYSNSMTNSAKLTLPDELSQFVAVEENNQDKLDEYIQQQDAVRGINIRDYIS